MDEMEDRHWRVLGHCIRGRRKEKEWSREELAGHACVSYSEVKYIETVERHPKSGTLKRLCRAFGISLLELMAQVQRVEDEWERDGR